MKLRHKVIAGIMAIALCVSVLTGVTMAKEKKSSEEVTILFTHDVHSNLDEFQSNGEWVGGVARLKTAIDTERAKNKATFVLDAGDFSMGTLYQTIYEKHATELTMLGRLGFDATTFGNHEFDYRAEGVANMLNSAVANAQADETLTLPQFVYSNIEWDKNDTEDGKLVKDALDNYGAKTYTVIERGGVKVGLFGLYGKSSDADAPMSGITFSDTIECAKKSVAALQKEGVDMIVCLSHCGTDPNPENSEDEILAQEVPEIDVIVSGHTHTLLEEPIVYDHTYIVSAECYGKYLGNLSLVSTDDGRWELKNYELMLMDRSIPEDEAIRAQLEEYKTLIDAEYLSEFGYKATDVLAQNDITFTNVNDMYDNYADDPMGSIISDSYIYAVQQAEGEDYEPVTAAISVVGCIRDTFQPGELTVSNAFNVSSLGIGPDRLPGYPLVSAYLTGKEIKDLAEVDVSVSTLLMPAAQLYPAGISWTYNPHRLILNRVTEITDMTTGEALEDDKMYRVIGGLYSFQMMGAVKSTSYGLLQVEPKDKSGKVMTEEDFEKNIVYTQDGAEVKEWYALATYLESFDKNSEGVSQVPARYKEADGRKIADASWNPIDLLKSPNKVGKIVYAVVIGLIVIIVLIVVLVRKGIKKHKAKKLLQKQGPQ